MDHSSGDKDTAFTWAMGRLIIQRIAEGETVKAITADPRMPAYCTVFRWMNVVPEFGARVAEVRAGLMESRRSYADALRGMKGRRRGRGGQRERVAAAALAGLLQAVRDGASVSAAVRAPGAPSAKALYSRVRKCPGFRAAFVQACAWRAFMLDLEAEDVVDRVGEMTMGIPEATVARRALFARKGRLMPKLYREDLAAELAHAAGRSLQPYHRDVRPPPLTPGGSSRIRPPRGARGPKPPKG
jgi:hypothetical protein